MNQSQQRCQQYFEASEVWVKTGHRVSPVYVCVCGPVPLTCQAVVALYLGALHGSPLLLGELGGGLVQQVDLGARRPVDNMHPFELQQRPVILAYRFPKFLLFVATVTLRLEVDGFLDLRLHLHFSRAGTGGSCQAPAAGLRVAFQALYRVLFGFHVSQ